MWLCTYKLPNPSIRRVSLCGEIAPSSNLCLSSRQDLNVCFKICLSQYGHVSDCTWAVKLPPAVMSLSSRQALIQVSTILAKSLCIVLRVMAATIFSLCSASASTVDTAVLPVLPETAFSLDQRPTFLRKARNSWWQVSLSSSWWRTSRDIVDPVPATYETITNHIFLVHYHVL